MAREAPQRDHATDEGDKKEPLCAEGNRINPNRIGVLDDAKVPLDAQEDAARAENEKFQPQDMTHGGKRDHAGTVTGKDHKGGGLDRGV